MKFEEYKNFREKLKRYCDSRKDDCSDCFMTYNCGYSYADDLNLNQFNAIMDWDETDWTKVPVDSKVRVWNDGDACKTLRHFARYENGKIYTFENGRSAWTSLMGGVEKWDHAILEEKGKEND